MSENITVRLNEKIRLAGMFAVINYFVDYLCWHSGRQSKARFRIELDNYKMYQEGAGEDVYRYYFAGGQEFESTDTTDTVHVPQPVPGSVTRRGLMTKYGRSNARELLPPSNDKRHGIGEVIQRYFSLNSATRKIVDAFVGQHFNGHKVVGVHLRGAGRLDGGTSSFKKRLQLEDGVPYNIYFEKINAFLKEEPDAKVLICSDSKRVIARVKKEYNDRVLTYDSQLTDFGESHIAAQQAKERGEKTDLNPKKMGEDVIVETYLLSQCDYFVHGNSNISNFIICLNPELRHDDIFDPNYSYNLKGSEKIKAQLRSWYFSVASVFLRVMGRINPKWGCPED